MKLNIKFHPLLFQASLAAGGVALMPFNYLHPILPAFFLVIPIACLFG